MAEVAQANTAAILETMGSETDDVFIKAVTNERLEQEGRYGKTENDKTCVGIETDNPPLTGELSKAEEKIQKLEHELERMAKALQHTEHVNTQLKDEIQSSHETADENKTQYMELLKVKESYDALSLELDYWKKKAEGSEQVLQSSFDDVKKLEELHEKSRLHAESESKRALELENLVGLAEKRATEQQDEMGSLKDRLHDQISENQKVGEESELLRQELELAKKSESKVKNDISALENQITSMTEKFQEKISEIEDLKLKLQEETEMRELIKGSSEEKVARLTMEKEALETSAINLTNNAEHMKELCSDLETKLKSLEELNLESVAASNAVAEEAKLRLQEIEQQDLDLKEKLNVFELKSTDAEREQKEMSEKISELHTQIQDYEDRINKAEGKFINAAAESQNYSDKVSELATELEAFRAKSESLEQILKIANESEKRLSEELISVTSEKRMFMEALDDSVNKLAEAENSVNLLQEELTSTKEKLGSMENDLKVAGEKETESVEKLKACEEQIVEAAEKSTFLKEELDQNLAKLASQEHLSEELKRQAFEMGVKASESFSEKEVIVEMNTQLKLKISELQGLVDTATTDKEHTSQELVEFQTRFVKAEKDLEEAIERLSERDLEGKELKGQIELYEKQIHEATESAKIRGVEFEEMMLRLKHLEEESEGVSVANLKLTQEIAAYEAKTGDLNAKLGAVLSEKDDAVEQLHSSRKAAEDLKQLLDSEMKKHQSEISSLRDENKMICQTYEDAKNEYETRKTKLEGSLEELKANGDFLKSNINHLEAGFAAETQQKEKVENSVAELTSRIEELGNKVRENDALNERAVQLEGELKLAKSSIDELTKACSRVELEKEAAVRKSEEADKMFLEQRVAELEQQLESAFAAAKPTEKVDHGVEIKAKSSPSDLAKRKGKKKEETAITATTPEAKVSSAMLSYKVIMIGTAVISVIFGIIVGKQF